MVYQVDNLIASKEEVVEHVAKVNARVDTLETTDMNTCRACNLKETESSSMNEQVETDHDPSNPILMLRALAEFTIVIRILANDIVAIKSDSIIVNNDVYSNNKEDVIEKVNNKFDKCIISSNS